MKVDDAVFEIAGPVVEKSGFELVDVEYVKEKDGRYLRVFIDKPGGITVDDCQLISEKLGRMIDGSDLIGESYFFEVSSPGLERVLRKDRELERYRGETVEIRLYKAEDGEKVFHGILKGHNNNDLYIEIDGRERTFARNDIALVKRFFTF